MTFLTEDPGKRGLKYVINCARRFGKTFTLIVIADQFARRNPHCHIRFAAPSKTQLKKIIHPSMIKLLETCPMPLRPKWRTGDSFYLYPNGAQLHLAGCDDTESMEALRGTESNLNIVTEGGSIVRLKYLINDILIPQTITTNGKTFIDSTVPLDPNHYFNFLIDEAIMKGAYSEFTLNDNTSLSEKTKQIYIREAGGLENPTCKREYFCEKVRDLKNAIIPEFDKSLHVAEVTPPKEFAHLDRYVAMDLGLVDKTVVLYGFNDFLSGKLKIQSELVLEGRDMKTSTLGEADRAKRKELWGNLPIHREVSDNNELRTLNDLNADYGFNYYPVKKETLNGMVNRARNLIGSGRLQVDPSCKELIGCLDSGVWDARRKGFGRHELFGHFDALAAMVYLILNLDESRNPIPVEKKNPESHVVFEEVTEIMEKLKERFTWKKSI